MEFRTIVDIPEPPFRINIRERMLFVGSCFAEGIGRKFIGNCFPTWINPYGVMYNPASIYHTVLGLVEQGRAGEVKTAFLTLGTNHIYILNETGEIVDNCQKRPQYLFTEKELSLSECVQYLQETINMLRSASPEVHIVLTVSPIRYRKYGYHGSQLSKAVLLLAADEVVRRNAGYVVYFPAYEIINDELRDYRFYEADMLHPSDQAVDYIWERLMPVFLSDEAQNFIKEWQPLRAALDHRPFRSDSPEYQEFRKKTDEKVRQLLERYPGVEISPILLI